MRYGNLVLFLQSIIARGLRELVTDSSAPPSNRNPADGVVCGSLRDARRRPTTLSPKNSLASAQFILVV